MLLFILRALKSLIFKSTVVVKVNKNSYCIVPKDAVFLGVVGISQCIKRSLEECRAPSHRISQQNLTYPPVLRVLLANTCEGHQGYQSLNREGYRKMSVVTSLCVQQNFMYVDNNKIRTFNCQTKLQHSTILHIAIVNCKFLVYQQGTIQ